MVKIEISTENSAFEGENKSLEVVRILKKLANRLENDAELITCKIALIDLNGNKVGTCTEEE